MASSPPPVPTSCYIFSPTCCSRRPGRPAPFGPLPTTPPALSPSSATSALHTAYSIGHAVIPTPRKNFNSPPIPPQPSSLAHFFEELPQHQCSHPTCMLRNTHTFRRRVRDRRLLRPTNIELLQLRLLPSQGSYRRASSLVVNPPSSGCRTSIQHGSPTFCVSLIFIGCLHGVAPRCRPPRVPDVHR